MKNYEINGTNGLDSVQLGERPDPTPGYHQVVIKVKAASLNYRDLVVASGGYGRTVPLPIIPLSDGAGEVVETGPGVTRVGVGDRVAPICLPDWLAGQFREQKVKSALGGSVDGMLAEYVVCNQESLVIIPEHLSYEEGATLPCAAVTAWNALNCTGKLKAGQSVLVQGTGGVSIFALQFAKMAGARVVATTSSDTKLQRLEGMGADVLVNYKTTPEWDKVARGVDHVVEVGGAGTLEKSIRAVSMGGTISLIGVLTGGTGEINPRPILMKHIRLQGILLGSREMFESMNNAVALHRLKPVIDRVFPLSEARAAYRHLASGAHFGKVVIRI
jgi:NADPH:quinone reductase-like Zn-dependent oxidoreductase